MKISLFLCLSIGLVVSAYQTKRNKWWYETVDEHGRLISENTNIDVDVDSVGNPLYVCPPTYFQCTSPKQCIPLDQVCNRKVECVDASDEKNCTCASRLTSDKLCDRYEDCPNGEDELGCFGCNNDEFSCYQEPSTNPKCFKKNQKCDRKSDCLNEKDEENCFLIAKELSSSHGFLIPTIDGILYYQGHENNESRVYPVCNDESEIPLMVCQRMLGADFEEVESFRNLTSYSGIYTYTASGELGDHFGMNCPYKSFNMENTIIRVKCHRKNVCAQKIKIQSEARIAGGFVVQPGSNPYIVGLFRNGYHTCGGSLITNKWVLTAAHCIRNKYEHYYEVRAGSHRLTSFSTDEQAVRVTRAMMHSGYDDETLKNDIALLEVETEFTFNKYVKPICLPDEKAVMPPGDDRQWLWGPYDTTCKIAGWGAITDRGPNRVDDQMEAYVPIVTTCDPNNTKLICAGYEEGGFDTCAGDSGGPFVCVNESNKNFIYLAGVTSGSYKVNGTESERYRCGTKGTYGTYTRTTHYILWIESIILKNVIPNDTDEIVFTKKCPGVLCLPSNRCAVRNGIPECLNAEDELDSSD